LIESAYESGNDAIAEFIKQVRDKLTDTITDRSSQESSFAEQATQQLLEWRNQQYIQPSDPIQASKITSRDNKVQTFEEGSHFQMKQEQLGINQSFNVPVMQGTINPNLKNVVERTVIIDSQYRPNVLPYSGCEINSPSFNTQFSVDLSVPLQNVLSMELYSIHIPQSWSNISSALGNNILYTKDTTAHVKAITVPDGFYTLNSFFSSPPNETYPYAYRTLGSSTEKITLMYHVELNRVVLFSDKEVIWYSNTVNNSAENCSCVNTNFINNNLGWLLGFRETDTEDNLVSSVATSVTASAAPNFNGPQYFLLSIDDYQQNRLNKGIISTIDKTVKLDMPTYTSVDNFTPDINGECVAVPTAPRQLTQAQLYTINTIYRNRKKSKTRPAAATTNNVLAVIPLPSRTTTPNAPLVLTGITLSVHAREYFGPVTIEKIGVKLVDDKGHLVDLNGLDWSFVFRVKQLYQY
jgi:hypothetical protein